jgi:uncharacterized membrane protein required for colicin V production
MIICFFFSGYILGLSSAIFNSFSAGAAAILGGSFNQAINSAFPTLSSQLANVRIMKKY